MMLKSVCNHGSHSIIARSKFSQACHTCCTSTNVMLKQNHSQMDNVKDSRTDFHPNNIKVKMTLSVGGLCVCVCVCRGGGGVHAYVHICVCTCMCGAFSHKSKRLAGGRGGSVKTTLKQLVCTMQAAKRFVNCQIVYSAVPVLTLPGSGALT